MSMKNEIESINNEALVTATGGVGRLASGGGYGGLYGGFHPWLLGGWGGGAAAAAAAANANNTNNMMMCCALASAMRPRGPYG